MYSSQINWFRIDLRLLLRRRATRPDNTKYKRAPKGSGPSPYPEMRIALHAELIMDFQHCCGRERPQKLARALFLFESCTASLRSFNWSPQSSGSWSIVSAFVVLWSNNFDLIVSIVKIYGCNRRGFIRVFDVGVYVLRFNYNPRLFFLNQNVYFRCGVRRLICIGDVFAEMRYNGCYMTLQLIYIRSALIYQLRK